MANERKLSDYTDMSEKDFNEALKRVDWKAWEKKPERALEAAGVNLRIGRKIELVDSAEAASQVSVDVLPLIARKSGQLSKHDLFEVTGGRREWWQPIHQLLWKQ